MRSSTQSPNRGSSIYMDVPKYEQTKNHANTTGNSHRSQSPRKGSNIYMDVPNYGTDSTKNKGAGLYMDVPNYKSNTMQHLYSQSPNRGYHSEVNSQPAKTSSSSTKKRSLRHHSQSPFRPKSGGRSRATGESAKQPVNKGALSDYVKIVSEVKSPTRPHHHKQATSFSIDHGYGMGGHVPPPSHAAANFRASDAAPFSVTPAALASDIRRSHDQMRLSNAAMDRALGRSRQLTGKVKNLKLKNSLLSTIELPKHSAEPDVEGTRPHSTHLHPNLYGYGEEHAVDCFNNT
jgi:hypothetical protein